MAGIAFWDFPCYKYLKIGVGGDYMEKPKLEYPVFSKIMKYALCADLLAFLTLMTASAYSVDTVKKYALLLVLLLSAGCLGLLYYTQELLRKRSFWMSVSAVSMVVCALCSLLVGYPSPNPLDQTNPYTTVETVSTQYTPEGWSSLPEQSEPSEEAANPTGQTPSEPSQAFPE